MQRHNKNTNLKLGIRFRRVLCNRTVDDDNSEDNKNDDNNHNNHTVASTEFDRNDSLIEMYRIEELLFKNKLVTDNLNI